MSFECLRNASAAWTKQYGETSRTHRQIVKFSKFVSCDVSQPPPIETKKNNNKKKTRIVKWKGGLKPGLSLADWCSASIVTKPIGFSSFFPRAKLLSVNYYFCLGMFCSGNETFQCLCVLLFVSVSALSPVCHQLGLGPALRGRCYHLSARCW